MARLWIVHWIVACLFLAGHSPTLAAEKAPSLVIFAAASLADALGEIGRDFGKSHKATVRFNFGSSSLLARQIEEGAPADVFFSADEEKMDRLDRRELIVRDTRVSLLSNSLVIVVPVDTPLELREPADLLSDKVKLIALGEPGTVPAGIYAKNYFERQELWPQIKAKMVPMDNVRAALAAVAAGNADAAVVYKTDAAISSKVKIACEIPHSETPEISYSVAVVQQSQNTRAAREFLASLRTPSATRMFERYGFLVRH